MFKKIGLLVFLLFALPIVTQAETVGFGAAPLLPENQLTQASYFDLLVKPGTSQDVQIQLENFENEPKTLALTPTTAFTNEAGKLDYSSSNHVPLAGPNFREITSKQQVITLQPLEKRVVTFTIDLPKEKFDGVLLGGIQITWETTSSGTLQQEVAYTIGVMLREDETLPEPKLQLVDVTTANNQLAVQLKNPTGALISQYQMTGSLSKGNQTITLAPQTISIAPQDAFTLILESKEKITAGNYTLKLNFSGEQSFDFQQAIQIEVADGELVVEEREPMYQLLWLVPVSLLLAIIVRRRRYV